MVSDLEKYVQLLKGKNIKITSPRLEIMRYLDSKNIHPSADRIYSDLKKKNPSLSKTTVYNTLEILERHGLIQALTITEKEYRYDFDSKLHHHHFLCERCNKIMDIEVSCPHLDKMLSGEHKVEKVHGYMKGICRDCIKKEPKKKDKITC